MSLDTSVRVEVPAHSVMVKNGRNTYVQYTVRAYRNSKGKPTSERVSIGKLDPVSGQLIPNRRYYELFEEKHRQSNSIPYKSLGLMPFSPVFPSSLG